MKPLITIDVSELPKWAQSKIEEVEREKKRWTDQQWTVGKDTLEVKNGEAFFNGIDVVDERLSVLFNRTP